MKTFFLFCFLTLFISKNYSQNDYYISTYINPINLNILNPNKDYNKTKHEKINIEYKNINTFEAGLNLIKSNPEKKLDFGLGISYKNFSYDYILYIEKLSSKSNNDYILRHRKFNLNTIGLKLISGKNIFNSSRVNFIIETYFPINIVTDFNLGNSKVSTQTIGTFGQNGTIDQSQITIKEITNPRIKKAYTYFIPEINFQTKINKSLFLNYGSKLKVWSIYNYHEINVSGYYSLSEQPRTLYSSIINSRHFSFYFGLLYKLNLKKSS